MGSNGHTIWYGQTIDDNDLGQLVESKDRPNHTIVSVLLCCHEGQDASAFALVIMNNIRSENDQSSDIFKRIAGFWPKVIG
jgi:hypothetical protein